MNAEGISTRLDAASSSRSPWSSSSSSVKYSSSYSSFSSVTFSLALFTCTIKETGHMYQNFYFVYCSLTRKN